MSFVIKGNVEIKMGDYCTYRHPKSCSFIDDIKGGVWVECGWCNQETPWIHKDNCWEFQSNENCLRCNKELIYPNGAEW